MKTNGMYCQDLLKKMSVIIKDSEGSIEYLSENKKLMKIQFEMLPNFFTYFQGKKWGDEYTGK